MGDALKGPVLLIKLAWGGKSLAKDFRPPSSGGEVGPFYTELVKQAREVLRDLKKHYPVPATAGMSSLASAGTRVGTTAINDRFNAEYEKNLANFIRDIRKDFGVPRIFPLSSPRPG